MSARFSLVACAQKKMARLKAATTSMSHQNGMLPVFVGGSGVCP